MSLASELAALFGLEQMELFMLLRVTASSTEGAAKLGLFAARHLPGTLQSTSWIASSANML